MKIVVGIVLFHPEIERFKECIGSLLKQVDKIILYDNVGDCRTMFNDDERLVYLTENENKGIAYALNRIMQEADAKGYDWVLTMDQDTLLPENLITAFQSFPCLENVGIICPQVIDKRRAYMSIDETDELYSEIEDCMTSASCTNLKIWKELGGFDEWLFIDFVDNDYCKRLRLNGYKIVRCNKITVDQEFGKIQVKAKWKVSLYLWLSKMFHNTNVAKLSYKKWVSPMRVYYVHRNVVYLNKKFLNFGGIGYANFNCKTFAGFLFYFSLPSIVRAQKKFSVLKSVIKGLRDGRNAAKQCAPIVIS